MRKLTLKKEILDELTAEELDAVNAGVPTQVLTENNNVCAQLSLPAVVGCLNFTCGSGCTNVSTVVKGL